MNEPKICIYVKDVEEFRSGDSLTLVDLYGKSRRYQVMSIKNDQVTLKRTGFPWVWLWVLVCASLVVVVAALCGCSRYDRYRDSVFEELYTGEVNGRDEETRGNVVYAGRNDPASAGAASSRQQGPYRNPYLPRVR